MSSGSRSLAFVFALSGRANTLANDTTPGRPPEPRAVAESAVEPASGAPSCGAGTTWDGAQCVAQPAPARGDDNRRCESAVRERGFDAVFLRECWHVNGACATEVVERGWHPTLARYCRGVSEGCAHEVLQSGTSPRALERCRVR